ncbi:MAG TPA: hypothetical protein VHE34_17900 [Puia sp.]|uniref:hypothetical protein n=1 Tax=Puia sp. TaxID=2045100 RepID=UPI002C24EF8A|nr:hypothetical protein [Puia sp.]HVU97111.1 hypothetical protein [Puia sp.]
MTKYIVFDNEGHTSDRYTIVDRISGNVFAACEQSNDAGVTGRYCGNCADHRVTLYGAGWRQMPLSQRIIMAETDNYVRNAQLNPDWLGKQLPWRYCPLSLQEYIATLDKMESNEAHRVIEMPQMGSERDGTPSKSAITQ